LLLLNFLVILYTDAIPHNLNRRKERKMKRETLAGFCVVVIIVVLVLAVFWVLDGSPAVDGLKTLVNVMEVTR